MSEARPAVAELVVVKGKHRGDHVKLESGPVVIGRTSTAGLPLPDDTKVSSQHARVTPLGGDRWLLEDLGSTNGTFLNDERIEQSPLRSGDLIRLGRTLLVFRADGSSVHLSDVRLAGGGSSADLRPAASRSATQAPGYQPPAQGAAAAPATAPAPAPAPATASAPAAAPPLAPGAEAALQELLLAGGELVFARRLERLLEATLRGTGAARAILFARHPLTGGLGAAAWRGRQTAPAQESPVQPELLRRAAAGEVVAEAEHAAAPLRFQGQDLGAIYLSGLSGETPGRLGLLAAAGLQAGVLLGAERARRLAEATCEVVGLVAHTPAPRPVDLSALLASLDRLFGAGARHRGLAWRVEAPSGLSGLADPVLLGRGLDTLVEHALSVARVELLVRAAPREGGGVRIQLARDRSEPPEVTAALLDPEGVAADLRRMGQSLDDGTLAVARVALERAGARLRCAPEGERAIYGLEVAGRLTDRAVS